MFPTFPVICAGSRLKFSVIDEIFVRLNGNIVNVVALW